jgi:hypothetical protein
MPQLDTSKTASSGYTLIGLETGPIVPGPVLPSLKARLGPQVGRVEDGLRVAIFNPAPANAWGDMWGDTVYAADLATALRHRGCQVSVYRSAGQWAESSALHQVGIYLRGPIPFAPHPGMVNVLWVISRPDTVTPAEVRMYDVVYAASQAWAGVMSERSGKMVDVLLQACNQARFSAPGDPDELASNGQIVFVGSARPKHPRKTIHDVIEVGGSPAVWGQHWQGLIPDQCIVDTWFDNAQLPRLYRQAKLVLADHWADMGREGFAANRLFEAAACGARVLSDPVTGLEEIQLEGLVRTYHGLDELAVLISDAGLEAYWPSGPERLRKAARIADLHSFDTRVDRILADVRLVLEH